MTRRRQLLGWALAAPAFVRFAHADEPRFGLGIASGSPRADGMVLWTRLTGTTLPAAAEVRWEVAYDEGFQRIAARGTDTALEAEAHTVHAEPGGLDPDRWYFYRFHALGQTSATGRTRTAPAADAAPGRLEFAIASCQRFDHGHYAAWRHAATQALDLVLFLGDYIYEYGATPSSLRPHEGGLVRTLAEYRARYAQYKRDPALQAAHAACPWIVIADDHEVENDYAGLSGGSMQWDFAGRRAAAYRAWWEHMPLPKALRPQDGALVMNGRLDWGRLARLHWVDDRQHRDEQACRPFALASSVVKRDDCAALLDPKRSLLGAAQERWLAEGWSLERPWNLLAQQTLMARFDTTTAWTDGWDGYPAARRRLLSSLAERRVPGAVVLGGDVHMHYVADLKPDWDDDRSPVVASEFCGTSIASRSGLAPERLQRALAEQPHLKLARNDRRGYVRFTLEPKQLQAQLLGVDDVRDPASPVSTLARFVVDAARPGPQPA